MDKKNELRSRRRHHANIIIGNHLRDNNHFQYLIFAFFIIIAVIQFLLVNFLWPKIVTT